jgi:Mn-containing catalase
MNKYLATLTKLASDLVTAESFHKDERHDVNKYTQALKKATDPKLRKALEFALPEEKQHAAKFEAAVKELKNVKKQAEMTNAPLVVSDSGSNQATTALRGGKAQTSNTSSTVGSDAWKELSKDPALKQRVLNGTSTSPIKEDYPAKGINNTNDNPYLYNNDFNTTRTGGM